MLLTHLGHSCLLVESADTRVLIDPGAFSTDWHGLRDLTAIVVTHQHNDHLDPDAVPGLVADNPGARLFVEPAAMGQVDALRDATAFTADLEEDLGGLRLRGVGQQHAVINEFIPRITNTGVVLSADGEPTLFHPGDAYDADPGEVDILALPVNAPWCASKETIDFVRRIAPRYAVPVHDALLSERGRTLYLTHAKNFSLEQTELVDLAGKGATTLT